MLLDVEEVGGLQVRVALLVAGVDGVDGDLGSHRRRAVLADDVHAPEKVLKLPRTLLTTRWRTEKAIDECTGSMAQVPALISVVVVAAVM